MAFDVFSFFGGLSKGAAEAVETRNEEIRVNAESEFKRLQKEASEQNEKVKSKRDELKATASVLASYKGINNVGFTEGQIIGLLQNPAVAKRVQAVLDKNADELDQIDFGKLYKVSKGQEGLTIDQYIKDRTTLPKPADVGPLPKEEEEQTKTAFGLPTKTLSQARAKFEATTGKSIAQLRTEAAGVPDEKQIAEGIVDFSQFKSPETTNVVSARLRDNIAKGIGLEDPRNDALVKKLRAAAIIENEFKDEDKERTASAISSVIEKTLKTSVDPVVFKDVVRFDSTINDWVPITGDAEAIKKFQDHKNLTVRDAGVRMGIISSDGKRIIGGRNVRDALTPYANIDKDGNITQWRTIQTGTGQGGQGSSTAATAPAPAQPAIPAKGATPAARPPTQNLPDINRARADANSKIAQNPALAARVRADFKRMYGQDL